MKQVLFFSEIRNKDVSKVGGKNASLGEMYSKLKTKGIRVPNGFALTSGAYDYFIKELKTRVPLVGFAFQCQCLDDDLPFDYHDVPMDLVITEEGIRRYS